MFLFFAWTSRGFKISRHTSAQVAHSLKTLGSLLKLKMIESPKCAFCKRENESLEHLFFNCYVTKFFWEAFCSWLIECSISFQPLTLRDIVFGIFNVEKDFNILNHLVLAAKLYIYKCKLNNVNPSLQVYKAKIKGVYQIEKRIATSRNKLTILGNGISFCPMLT